MRTANEWSPSATGRPHRSLMRARAGRLILRTAVILSVFCLHACEIPTSISVEGKDVPVFRLSGAGSIYSFGVGGNDGSLWTIEKPDHGTVDLSRLGPITYGVVPPGSCRWSQKTGRRRFRYRKECITAPRPARATPGLAKTVILS
jgi:hypothetical protein